MMTSEQFEQTLRELLERRPYTPIQVVLDSGRVFEIDDPQYVARDGNTAGYIDAKGEPYYFDNRCVVEFIPGPVEVTS
jgi:hypothetical protein